jgi:hypothetical protein
MPPTFVTTCVHRKYFASSLALQKIQVMFEYGLHTSPLSLAENDKFQKQELSIV